MSLRALSLLVVMTHVKMKYEGSQVEFVMAQVMIHHNTKKIK